MLKSSGRASALAIAIGLVAGQGMAQDAALVIGNENYRNADDIRAADDSRLAAEALEKAGFRLRLGGDMTTDKMRALLAQHLSDMSGPGRSVILLAGHFAHSGERTWLLGAEADRPDLSRVDAQGLAVDTVLRIAAERPGGAIVILGTEDRKIPLGRGLVPGIGPVEVPQGVMVISGDAAEIADFTAGELLQPGQSHAQIADRARAQDLAVMGYLGALAPFLPPKDTPQQAQGATADERRAEMDQAERTLWQSTREIGTVAAYESYLRRYPDGPHAAEARRAIEEANDPVARARAAEEAMKLTRDQRRQVQRDLSILDIDPKGIDGIFGPGSRRAIATWQAQNGHEATGYLTADQRTQLAAQAERRAAELEAEAAKRQAEQERQDRLYWEQTGAAGDEAGLRAYLKRYPDGLFAELAQERLAVFEERRRAEAQAADRAAWDRAESIGTPAAWREYLAAYPNGAFADQARARLAEAEDDNRNKAEIEQAQKVENALGLNAGIRRLIEQRLDALGLKPGRVDGNFDKDTRRAIRRYQTARGLPVTGYLNQQTVARLLIDSL
ncbi:putative peptidoglycan binding protein [Albidovulum inexpectatum]|uniref:Putative peptidoglycan binding protein n=1 Tax=Albidovulum inexpectatum TaxID=196587 RepID=A0A2S5JM76_9RHOB|nr:peptidoglycan-binding protein [Albidovulum inexpectatum]PPB82550.1 putative peptidoglycan binding protein [Albidovulum inexpectatum]